MNKLPPKTRYRINKAAFKSLLPVGGKKLNKRQKKEVKRIVNVGRETKYNDVTLNAQTSTNTVGIQPLISINQGTTDITRVGDEIKLKAVEFQIKIEQTPATAAGIKDNHVVRVLIIQWKGATTPAAADIFQYTGAGVMVSPIDNDRQRKLLKVLYDRKFYLQDAGPSITGNSRQIIKRFAKRITFSAGSASPQDNQLYFVNVSDYTAAAGEVAPTYYFASRVKYTDS